MHVLSTVEGQAERHYRDQEVYVHRYGQWLWTPLDVRMRYRVPLTRKRLRTALSNYFAYRRLRLKFDIVEAPEWMGEGLAFSFARQCLWSRTFTVRWPTATRFSMAVGSGHALGDFLRKHLYPEI